MKCDFCFDDGAYVLGALAPAERAEFERHLATCPSCRDEVAALAVLPGLLGRLDAATAIPAIEAPPSILLRTMAAVATRRRAERRRRLWTALAAGLAALVVATGAGLGVHMVDASPASPPGLSAMVPVTDHVPVTAELALVAAAGGTRVDMQCRYSTGYDGLWIIRLVVFPRWGGTGEQIGTWTATSGQVLSMTAMTHLSPEDIGRVELQRADQTPLLTWSRV